MENVGVLISLDLESDVTDTRVPILPYWVRTTNMELLNSVQTTCVEIPLTSFSACLDLITGSDEDILSILEKKIESVKGISSTIKLHLKGISS